MDCLFVCLGSLFLLFFLIYCLRYILGFFFYDSINILDLGIDNTDISIFPLLWRAFESKDIICVSSECA